MSWPRAGMLERVTSAERGARQATAACSTAIPT
jgi:hypothetical protein